MSWRNGLILALLGFVIASTGCARMCHRFYGTPYSPGYGPPAPAYAPPAHSPPPPAYTPTAAVAPSHPQNCCVPCCVPCCAPGQPAGRQQAVPAVYPPNR